jgi:hypothetical protein
MTKTKLRNILKASIPIFVGILILLIYTFFVKTFIYCDWGNCEPIEQSLVNALPMENVEKLTIDGGDTPEISKEKNEKLYRYFSLELSGRTMWASLEATYFISSAISFFVAFYIIYRSIDGNKKRSVVIGAIFIFVAAIGLLLFQRPEILMRIIIQLSALSIAQNAPHFQKIFHAVNAVGFAAIVALAVAEVYVLLPNYELSASDFSDDIKRKTNYLNSILLASMILLVNAIIVLQSVFRWASAFFVQDASMLSFSAQLSQNFIVVWSIEFTAILAAVYLPGYFLLQSYAISRTDGIINKAKEKQLKEFGLMLTPIEILSRILAIIAPLIANPIFDVVMKAVA